MKKTINLSIRDKIAVADNTQYVCGNSDFILEIDFDAEWHEYSTKTARFVYGGEYQDVVFQGSTCPVPVLSNIHRFYVGIFAGDLRTTTPASVSAKRSILCGGGVPADPPDDVYAQIMELLNKGGGTATDPSAVRSVNGILPDEVGNVEVAGVMSDVEVSDLMSAIQ